MSDIILQVRPLGFPWWTLDPFLFCVHHLDFYPPGQENLGPDPRELTGRNIGMDFTIKDGWRMYHGDEVPGFPQHPHRGFETITVARQGFIDHSDSMGATARFGKGDCQWMTAGKGIQHSEMFPLLDRDEPNTGELFQIWINLPARSKMVEPHFTMMWSPEIPSGTHTDAAGKKTEWTAVAGAPEGYTSPAPPPDSWAADPANHVAVWTLKLEPGAKFTVPAGVAGLNRVLYFFDGQSLKLAGKKLAPGFGAQVRSDVAIELENGGAPGQLLMLQGKPIGEPVVSHGPFVMNTHEEIRQAFHDYQRTRFGGWPWKRSDPAHPRETGRFAIHADGRREEGPKS